jgi:hypothetical protein
VLARDPANFIDPGVAMTLEKRTPYSVAAVLALLCMLVGCDRSAGGSGISTETQDERDSAVSESGAVPQQHSDEMVDVMVDHVSYRHDRSMQYTLLDMRTNPPQPVGGAIVDRLSGGGEKGCCVKLPKTWRPGIKLRVTWSAFIRNST